MRVMQLLSSTAFHGAESMAAELMRQLHALGVENHLALLDNAGTADTQIVTETQGRVAGVVRLPCGGAFDLRTFRALSHYMRSARIDVVHSHKYKTTFYALPVCRLQDRALVTTYHNWITTAPTLRAYAALDKAIARFNDVAVGVSTPVMTTLKRHVPPERSRQIDNGVDVSTFVPPADRAQAKRAVGLPVEVTVVGCVGRLSMEKGLDRLLAALAALPPLPPWLLIVVGDGDQRAALEAQAQALGLADRCRFLGRRSDTAALYRAFDVFALPSRTEAFPMALLEAMASGCYCVAADVGEVRRMVEGGRAGRLVAGEGADPWIEPLAQALAGSASGQHSAALARQRVVECYSAGSMARAYLQAYDDAVRRHQPPRARQR